MSKVKYFSKGNGLTKLLYMSKNALNLIDYKRCKEVVYTNCIKKVDDANDWSERTMYIGWIDSYKWHSYSYQEKYAVIGRNIGNYYSRLGGYWAMSFGDSFKREIEQLVIIIGEYMRHDDVSVPTFTRDDYIQVDGELLEKIIIWDSMWQDMVPDHHNRAALGIE